MVGVSVGRGKTYVYALVGVVVMVRVSAVRKKSVGKSTVGEKT